MPSPVFSPPPPPSPVHPSITTTATTTHPLPPPPRRAYHLTRSGFFMLQGLASLLVTRRAVGRDAEAPSLTRFEEMVRRSWSGPATEAMLMFWQASGLRRRLVTLCGHPCFCWVQWDVPAVNCEP